MGRYERVQEVKFCDYWMHNDPFGADLKVVKTSWHEYPATYPTRKNTRLWIMDDWRMMVVILRSNIEMFNKHWKDVDL